MSYKKKAGICPGEVEHPTREGLMCWGNHDAKTEGHWAYIKTSEGLRRISWRTE